MRGFLLQLNVQECPSCWMSKYAIDLPQRSGVRVHAEFASQIVVDFESSEDLVEVTRAGRKMVQQKSFQRFKVTNKEDPATPLACCSAA